MKSSSNGENSTGDSIEFKLKARAAELGFELVGITSAEPSAFAAEYRDWIANGYAGEMGYMTRNVERRIDPRELLPNARSIIVVGMNYYTRDEGRGNYGLAPDGTNAEGTAAAGRGNLGLAPEGTREEAVSNDLIDLKDSMDLIDLKRKSHYTKVSPAANKAIFARYARGDDYHDVITPRLRVLLEYLKAAAGPETEGRVYVDTGPILEREVARRAGLGWFGKNTMLINTRRGSYFFLGEIVTNVALTPDEPAIGGCGTCTRCLDACPTNAFAAPYVLDSRRCISYLTIELKGAIPEEFVPAIAETNRIYGCDICQEVCPFNTDRGAGDRGDWEMHGASPTREPAFQPRDITVNSKVTDLLYITDEEFREKFKGSPVKRAKRRGLLRNAAAALASRDDEDAKDALKHALNDTEELAPTFS